MFSVIAQNSEKFVTFGYEYLGFKDSFSFLQSSLEKLVKVNKNKEIDGEDVLIDNWQNNFSFSRKNPHVKNDEDLHYVTEKGIYPYDYMNTWEKFDETELPSKENFYSLLTEENISDEDYEFAKGVWKILKIKDLGQ